MVEHEQATIESVVINQSLADMDDIPAVPSLNPGRLVRVVRRSDIAVHAKSARTGARFLDQQLRDVRVVPVIGHRHDEWLFSYQFSHRGAKTADGCFRGFPCYWNVVVFYLLLLELEPWLALGIIVALCLAIFVPLRYLHPARTRPYRLLTLPLTVVWGAALIVALAQYPERQPWLNYGSLLFVAYYTGMSFYLTRQKAA